MSVSNKNIIVFALWGSREIFTRGLIENLKLAPHIYSDWKCRVYYDNTVPEGIINEAKKYEPELIDMTSSSKFVKYEKLFWRLLPLSDKTVERFISRDCDSRLSTKEFLAVQEWINSEYLFHSMRDSIHHSLPLQGGMWGAKPCVQNIQNDIDKFLSLNLETQFKDQYFMDQLFLNNVLWPKIQDICMCHTSSAVIGSINKPFPINTKKYYIGQIINEDGTVFIGDTGHFK